ncbi:autotransporter outer membrane beta-barrel domain-containing protein, partial [Escherichia coli]|nr:autotransporter outer membrane beta-barrel domain-containing protein [Escherichia coli]
GSANVENNGTLALNNSAEKRAATSVNYTLGGKHRESNGTLVHSNGDGNVQTRLGVKTWLKSHHKMDDGKSREFQPFVEVNWLHNSKDFSTSMDGVSVTQDGARNIAEIKTGV